MKLTIHNHASPRTWQRDVARFRKEHVLQRLHAIDARARSEGLEALNPADDPLIPLGMEVDAGGVVTKNSYGAFHLSWDAARHPEWAGQLREEATEIRDRIRSTHGTRLRFVIWAGMGGSVEDKVMYDAVGLLRGGPRFYALDSTDPAKLRWILADIERRSRGSVVDALRSTLVVGMALGMTSYEPVVNLEKLTALYERHRIDSRPNFIYLTLPGSVLDRFAGPRGYRRVALQMDEQHTTSGRHNAPMTRGALLPLALAGADLDEWLAGAQLPREDIQVAWQLAAYLHGEGVAGVGRDKVTLVLPRSWRGVGMWTKQDFEESLGKSEGSGIKIVIDEPLRAAYYRDVSHPLQDRVFLAVRFDGDGEDPQVSRFRNAGYPGVTLHVPRGTPLSRYMQFVHYVVFGIGYVREMNFVTQPSVDLYKSIAKDLHSKGTRAGGVMRSKAWRQLTESPQQARWGRRVALYYDGLPGATRRQTAGAGRAAGDAAAIYAQLVSGPAAARNIEYGELTFFGDLRYNPAGRGMRAMLERAGERVFRRALKMPVDVYEGPAMNHSYHEMIIGHGRCFSTVVLARTQDALPRIGYSSEYHVAQFLATRLALLQRGRHVVALVINDLTDASLREAAEFFAAAASHLGSPVRGR